MSCAGKTVMSWHESVDGVGDQFVPDGCCGVVGAFWRPLMTSPTCISRALCTTAAFCGAAKRDLDHLDEELRLRLVRSAAS